MARLTNKELQARFAAKLRTTNGHRDLHKRLRLQRSAATTAWVALQGAEDEHWRTYWQGSYDFWTRLANDTYAALEREDQKALASL